MSKTTVKFNGQAVVLVHGLWMGRWAFGSIAKFLKKHGYHVYRFGYKTSASPFDFNKHKLQAFVNSRNEQTVHIVAHSMGGILSMRTLPKIRKTGKLIMLGSPINGSQAATAMGKKKWTSWMLRHATEPLENGVQHPKTLRKSLMIAGTVSGLSISRLVTKLPKPNDGTVALVETQAKWINHHSTEKTNHFFLLLNKNAKTKILDFLTNETKIELEI